MDIKELKSKTQKELNDLLVDSRKQLRALTFDKSVGKMKKSHEYGELKKTIARVLTLIKINTKNK